MLLLVLLFLALGSAYGKNSNMLLRARGFPSLSECGLHKVTTSSSEVATAATAEEFPWLAALQYRDILTGEDFGLQCDGLLITQWHVLTAAHCFYFRGFKVHKVWLGVWKHDSQYTAKARRVKKHSIKKTFVHPNYDPFVNHSRADLGVIKFAYRVKFNDYMRPICLQKPHMQLHKIGSKLVLAGWGILINDPEIRAMVTHHIVWSSSCDKYFSLGKHKVPLDSTQVCIEGKRDDDACQGDMGAPLMDFVMHLDGRDRWYAYGVASFGSLMCGIEHTPAVYTRTSSHMAWIVDVVQENNPYDRE